jgi:hypothetical protein
MPRRRRHPNRFSRAARWRCPPLDPVRADDLGRGQGARPAARRESLADRDLRPARPLAWGHELRGTGSSRTP